MTPTELLYELNKLGGQVESADKGESFGWRNHSLCLSVYVDLRENAKGDRTLKATFGTSSCRTDVEYASALHIAAMLVEQFNSERGH